MGATLSRRERLQIRLDLLREAVRELEQELDAEQDPGRHRQKPKLRLIKGGLILAPLVFGVRVIREHTVAVAASAGTAAVGVVTGAALVVGEMPAPTDAAPPAVISSVQRTRTPSPVLSPAPGTVGPTPEAIPPAQVSPVGEPGLAATPVNDPPLAGGDEAPPPGLPTLQPTADTTPVLDLEPMPTVTPSPSPTQVWTQATARLHCLAQSLPPGPTLNDCVSQLLSAG